MDDDILTRAALVTAAFELGPVGMMVLSDRRIVVANRPLAELFGWPQADLQGQSVRVLYPSSIDFETTGERWHRWLETDPDFIYEDERFMRRRDGEILWMRARGRTLTPEDPFRLTVWSFERLADTAPNEGLLTTRERQIARKLVNGRTSKEIAIELGISPRTVEVHRASLLRKMGVQNTAELVARMIVKH